MFKNIKRRKLSSLIYIPLVVLVITLLDLVFFFTRKEIGNLVFHFEVIAGLTIIIALVLEMLESSDILTDSAKRLGDSVNQMRSSLHTLQKQEIDRFIKQHPPMGKVLQEWHQELEDALSFTADHKGFIVTHEMQAIRSYQIFWENLVREQRERTIKSPLNVLIIHSCALDIWSEYAVAKQLLGSHRQFCDNGGKITRILCAEGEPTEEIKRVAEDMKNAGVEVFYYNINSAKTDFRFLWDFLYVKETEAAVIWDSFDRGGNIKASTYQVGKNFREQRDLEDLWHNIRQHAVSID